MILHNFFYKLNKTCFIRNELENYRCLYGLILHYWLRLGSFHYRFFPALRSARSRFCREAAASRCVRRSPGNRMYILNLRYIYIYKIRIYEVSSLHHRWSRCGWRRARAVPLSTNYPSNSSDTWRISSEMANQRNDAIRSYNLKERETPKWRHFWFMTPFNCLHHWESPSSGRAPTPCDASSPTPPSRTGDHRRWPANWKAWGFFFFFF